MSELQSDSLEAYERLLSEQANYIDHVDKEIEKWKQFKNDYQVLQKRLTTLPDRLTYECMVPFGKLAFIPGRIIHSNEILVLLGDNYFVERSCKQAKEMVQRRLTNIQDRIKKQEKEKEVFNQQKQYTTDFLDDKTKYFEIKETDDDIKQEKQKIDRRSKLTEDEIREERRKLQERAMKLNEKATKRVHFDETQMEIDSDNDDDDDDEIPHKQMKKILIHHTPTESPLVSDSSSGLFPHPGAIGRIQSVAFTGKTVERVVTSAVPTTVQPPKRISKFKADRQ